MTSFCSFVRTATIRQITFPRVASRNFTLSTQRYKFQAPKPSTKNPPPNMTSTTLKGQPLDRPTLDSMLRRRLFYTPSFEIYGGVAGLYDYGPVSYSFPIHFFATRFYCDTCQLACANNPKLQRHKKTPRYIEKAAKAAVSMT